MPALDNDSAALLAAVRRDAFIAAADDQGNWTDPRILSIADDMTVSMVAPALKRTKQGWFRQDFGLTLVASQAAYDVPEEGMWESIEAAWLVNPTTGQLVQKINIVDSSNRMMYSSANAGVPTTAWFQDSQLVFSPAPSASAVSAYSMTVSAYRRPAQLCLVSDTARVTVVNTITQAFSITAHPTTWTTDAYTSGTPYRLDIYNRLLPNTRKLWNQTMTGAGTTMTMTPAISAAAFATIAVGDVVTMRGTSPYPDFPPEAVPILRRMIQKTILTAQTDSEALQAYFAQQTTEMEALFKGMANRADGSPRKLSLANAAGAQFMRNYGSRYRRN